MKIAYLLLNFPKISESFILNEIIEEIKANIDVFVFSLNIPAEEIVHDDFEKYNLIDRTFYYKFSEISKVNIVFFSMFVLKCIAYEMPNFRPVREIFKVAYFATIMKEKNITHIHTHFATRGSYAKELSNILNIPYTLTTHAYDIYVNQNGTRLKTFLENAGAVVTISDYNRTYLQKEISIENNIEVIRCGIDPEKFASSKKKSTKGAKTRILTVSRLVQKKGIDYLIKSIPLIVKRNPECEFVIIGSGPLRESLNELAVDLNVDSYLTFRGNASDEELMNYFSESDIFVLPCIIANDGDRDGIPVSLMEAMAMELPVVSTTVSGIPELIENGVSGVLVEPENEEAISDAIIRLSEDEELRIKMGNSGRTTVVGKFNQATEAKKLMSLFREIERKF